MSSITIASVLPYIQLLESILSTHKVCKSHGTRHAIAVCIHAIDALKHNAYPITATESLAVVLASLLHDADDHKFFPAHDHYENLKSILRFEPETSKTEFIDLVVDMVSLVSSSRNGDSIPSAIHTDKAYWKLIPRYADRLEALGVVGIIRCRNYNQTSGRPLYRDSTPRPENYDELLKAASIERYNSYNGNSSSMMDNYFDKLIRLGFFPDELVNSYFDTETAIRHKPVIDFVFLFDSKSNFTAQDIDQFLSELPQKSDIERQFEENIDWVITQVVTMRGHQ
jgi:uncharacterized protein